MAIPLIAKIIIITGSVIIGVASTLIFKLKKDNPVEQVAEEVIKEETGVSIDLTPEDLSTTTSSDKKE